MSEAEHIPRHSAQYQEALTRFILFWGEMASRWGINRTMAQIHALLYASEAPLDTDEIMGRLQISRGNASMNLRSLILWDLVRKVHQPGSRKDYYTAEKDVWKITARIIKEREKRELQPVMNQLQECRKMLLADEPRNGASDDQTRRFAERIDNLIDLMQVFEGFTQALFPFIQERTMSEAKDLIELASNLVMTGND